MNTKERLEKLGGVSAVAKHFGCDYQRIYNWIKRGVPSKMVLDHPELFQSDNPPNLKATQNKTP